MKKFLALLFVLTLGLNAVAFAADSPVLTNPPVVSEVVDSAGNPLWVILQYNEQSLNELDAVAKSVAEGKTELDHFALSEEDTAKLETLELDLAALSVDELLNVTVGGYTEKPESVTFKATFTVPYEVGTKVAVLMGVGAAPGPYQWTAEEGVVNEDGTVTVTLTDFPEETFLLSILS